MKSVYASPLRVYLCLGALAFAGLLSGLKLPVSLFPNSSKPAIWAGISYGNMTPEEFLNVYGRQLEHQLKTISADSVEVEKVTASYNRKSVDYNIEFKWGTQAQAAQKEVELQVNSFASRFPTEVRDSVQVWPKNENAGFLAISFFSPTRSLDDLYQVLDPVLMPKMSGIQDAQQLDLWNPTGKEIRVELNPSKMAGIGSFSARYRALHPDRARRLLGGSVTIGTHQLTIEMPRDPKSVEDLNRILVSTPNGGLVHLSDLARIDVQVKTTNSQSFKTSGVASLILFATPRPGGNIKNMAEQMVAIVEQTMPELPKDIQYKVLVDPSEFIRSAIHNVFREVGMGAFLAVLVLFLFIGSLRNTITAAIEIPLSMVLAFILMRFSGMNLNLISLGGLALSAGMNVDASVVVMENIFRHFEEEPGPHTFEEKLRIIVQAVSEVRFAVIASTIASLVVFLPLAFTSDLSYAILGDLAKTVVFSHGFSAFVALVLVPTVRLHLMGKETSAPAVTHSPIERQIRKVEDLYGRALGAFIRRPKLQGTTYLGLATVLAVLAALVLPRLPREIIGRPDTDWMIIAVNTSGNTVLRQMESQADEIEARSLKLFGPSVGYVQPRAERQQRESDGASRDKGEMHAVWKKMEEAFPEHALRPLLGGPVEPVGASDS